MAEIYLNDIAHGRSGDKGDTSNVCVYARKPEYYKIIEREVTPEKLKAYFGDMVKGEITRYDVPSFKHLDQHFPNLFFPFSIFWQFQVP